MFWFCMIIFLSRFLHNKRITIVKTQILVQTNMFSIILQNNCVLNINYVDSE